MANIDSLTIQITADATKANNALERLTRNLTKLNTTLGGLDATKVTAVGTALSSFATAASSLSSVKTSDFTRLVKNINSLNTVNTANMRHVSYALNSMARSITGLGSAATGAASITTLVNALSRLGGKSVSAAIANMPRLTREVSNMVTTFSKLPRVNSSVIRLIEAMAKLATAGGRVGAAFTGLSRTMRRFGVTASSTSKSVGALSGFLSRVGRIQLFIYTLRQAASMITKVGKSGIETYESLNYFNVAIDKVASNAKNEWQDAGYSSADAYYDSFSGRLSDLIGQMTGYDVSNQDLVYTNMSSLGLDVSQITQASAAYIQMADSIGMTGESALNTSKALTMLAADWSSLKNIDMEDSLAKMESALAGQSRAVRSLGIDITQATLGELAMNLGIEKSITVMTQSEKSMLRVIQMLRSSEVAYGDLARTINSPANQMRIFQAQVQNVTRSLSAIFLPAIQKTMPYINGFTIAINRMLIAVGNLIGVDWSQNVTSVADAETAFDDLEEEIGDVADAQDKLNKSTRKWDEINNISSKDSGSGSELVDDMTNGILNNALQDSLGDYEKKWNEAFSRIDDKAQKFADNIQEFFKPLTTTIKEFANKIKWDKVVSAFTNIGGALANISTGLLTGFVEYFSPAAATIINGVATALSGFANIDTRFWADVAGAIGGVITVFLGIEAVKNIPKLVVTVISNIAAALSSLLATIAAHPVLAMAYAVGALMGAIIVDEKQTKNAEQLALYGDTVENLIAQYDRITQSTKDLSSSTRDYVNNYGADEIALAETLATKYFTLAEKEELTNGEKEVMKTYVGELARIIPELNKSIDSETGLITIQKDEVDKLIASLKEQYRTEAAKERLIDLYNQQFDAEENLYDISQSLATAQEEYNRLVAEQTAMEESGTAIFENANAYEALSVKVAEAKKTVIAFQEQYDEQESALSNLGSKIDWCAGIIADSATETEGVVTESMENSDNAIKTFSDNSLEHTSNQGKFRDNGKKNMQGYNEGISNEIPKIESKTDSFRQNMIDKMNLSSTFKDLGKNTMDGFGAGIDEKANSIFDKVGEVANTVSTVFGNMLQIHSPSRVFKAFGIYSGEGYEEGLEESFKGVMSTLDDYTGNIVTSIEMPKVDYSAYGRMAQNTFDTVNASTDMSETNSLLRTLISAVQNGSSIQIDGKEIAKAVRNEANDYTWRNGKPYFAY